MIKVQKKWRELPKDKRYQIPTKYFNIDEKTLKQIRKISDVKKKIN